MHSGAWKTSKLLWNLKRIDLLEALAHMESFWSTCLLQGLKALGHMKDTWALVGHLKHLMHFLGYIRYTGTNDTWSIKALGYVGDVRRRSHIKL